MKTQEPKQTPDLDSREHIAQFIQAFYAKLLADPQLAPIFVDVARIDLSTHLSHIQHYWEKLLLGADDYHRHTMNIHRALNAKQRLTEADFSRWLSYFVQTVDDGFSGPGAERAKQVATHIARNMQRAMD